MDNQKDGRFRYRDIHRYLSSGIYPDGYGKPDKQALRKRAKFFRAKDAELFHVGGHREHDEPAPERLVVEHPIQRRTIIPSIRDSCHLGVNRTNDRFYWHPYRPMD